MNETERAALLQSALMFDEMQAAVDKTTFEILQLSGRRRRA
jgi:hypothetical protein